MSTVAVARSQGFVAIAADTMTKIGTTNVLGRYKRAHSKLLPVGDGFIGFVGAGLWQQVLTAYFVSLEEVPVLDSVGTVYKAMCSMHHHLKRKQFLTGEADNDFEFEETGITALLANPHGIFGIFSDRSVLEFSQFFAFGSGRSFALGAMHLADASGKDAEEIVRAGICASAEFDENTALPMDVRVIPMAQIDAKRNGSIAGTCERLSG